MFGLCYFSLFNAVGLEVRGTSSKSHTAHRVAIGGSQNPAEKSATKCCVIKFSNDDDVSICPLITPSVDEDKRAVALSVMIPIALHR